MPFAPQANTDLAGQYLFNAITRAGETIGAGVGDLISGLKARSKERKAYLSLADTLAESGELSEAQHAALQSADVDTIKGLVQGKLVASQLKQAQQLIAEQGARTDLIKTQAQNAKDESINAALQPDFMAAMERYLGPSGGYEAAAQTREGREAMIAGTVPPQMSPLSAISRAASETKYRIRPNQLDDILRAAGTARTGPLPPGFTPTKATIGGVTYEAPPAPVNVPPGFNPTQIVIGEDGKPRYTLEPTAPPVPIPGNMQPKTVTVDTKGKPTVTYAEPDASKKLAGNYPWLLDDDMEKFKAGLREIADPAERNAVIATRNHYEQALGRPSLLERFLMGGGETGTIPTATPTKTAAAAKAEKPPAAPAVKVPPGRVRVIAPDGRIGNIPAAQLQEALKAGYRQLD